MYEANTPTAIPSGHITPMKPRILNEKFHRNVAVTLGLVVNVFPFNLLLICNLSNEYRHQYEYTTRSDATNGTSGY